MTIRKQFYLVVLIAVSACSTPPIKDQSGNDIRPDVVLLRIDNMSERPSWLKESETFKIEDGKVLFLGKTTIPGNNRVEAGVRIAENSAKSLVAGIIEQKLEFIFQNAEEGTGFDATQSRYIGAEASKLITSTIRPYKTYWEKYQTTLDSGEKVTRYSIFSLMEMPEADFKKAIIDASNKRQGKAGLSADFAKKVDDQWNNFVNSDQNLPSQPKTK